jgi:tight adherence protein B
MRLLAGLLTGAAVAQFVAAALGVRWPVPPAARRRMWSPRAWWSGEARLWVGAACLGVSTLAVVWAATGSLVVAAGPALLAGGVPASTVRSRRRREAKELLAAWPDALRSVLAAVGAGRSPHEALVELARSGPTPLRPVFTRYAGLALHVGETRALAAVRDELADPVADRVFEVLAVAVESGARVAITILREVADSTSADIHLAERLDTAQAEQRITARVALVVPFLALVVLCSRPGPIRDYYASADGVPVILAGTALSMAGALVVRRLGRLPEEPRVVVQSVLVEEGR